MLGENTPRPSLTPSHRFSTLNLHILRNRDTLPAASLHLANSELPLSCSLIQVTILGGVRSFGATLGWVVPLSETVWTQTRCLGFSSVEPPDPNEPYRDTTIPELACNSEPYLSALVRGSKPSS